MTGPAAARLPGAGIPGVVETRDAVASGVRAAADVAAESLAAIDALNPRLNAFLEVFHEEAMAQARARDSRRRAGEPPGPLEGVPVALKDNLCLAWGRTTCASRMLEHYRSPFTATALRRLIDAGAIIVGKTNLDEFAMGSSTEHSAFGPTRNPWDLARVPGGSSGGSAAAVASGMVPLALGSDTGGSVRQPAAMCGVVGLKPTYGRVSRYGLVAFASSLDQVGPMARSVADTALALDVIAGRDPLDATSADRPGPDAAGMLDCAVPPLTIGVVRSEACGAATSPRNHPAVDEAIARAVEAFRGEGVVVRDVTLPRADAGIAAYYIVAPAEASSNLARYDGVRFGRRAEPSPGEDLEDLYRRSRGEGFGPEVRRRIMLGTHVLSSGYYGAYYTTALRARRLIKADYDAAFDAGCDALLSPATPGPAFRIGEKTGDPLALYLEDIYTVGVNLAGLPAVTIPAGMASGDASPLPVGVQLIGRAFEEATLLRAARVLERALGMAGLVAPRPA